MEMYAKYLGMPVNFWHVKSVTQQAISQSCMTTHVFVKLGTMAM